METGKDRIVIITIIVSVFLFLFATKTLTSGFHFVDDHEVINIKSDLKVSPLSEVTKKWVMEDLRSNARFRPLYYIHRVFQTRVFGSDFLLWSLYNGILCCIALISFYTGMRNLRFGIVESIIFLIITFIGPQSSVWWRLGPGEGLGMVFLGLSFYFMAKSSDQRNYLVYNLLFIFFLILASLTKESFLIIIPGMIFFKIWNDKIYNNSTLKESVFKNKLLLIPLSIMFLELYFIKYYVSIIYSGLDAKFTDNIPGFLSTGLHFVKDYLKLLVVGFVLLTISWLISKRVRKFDIFPFVFFLLILTPNIILYAKSGLEERYLLPASFGLGFFVTTLISGINEKPDWFKKLGYGIVILSLWSYMITSLNDALKFSREGLATKELLTAISGNNKDGAPVIVIVDPIESYEISVSLKTYLSYENQIDLYGYGIVKVENSSDDQGYVDGWKSYFNGRLYDVLTSSPGLLIFLDNNIINEFFDSKALSETDYSKIEMKDSPFVLFKRNP